MTMPQEYSPVAPTGDPLEWEAQSEKNKAAAKQAQASNAVVTPMQTSSHPDDTFQNVRNDVLEGGQALTQGVQQSAIAKAQHQKELEQQQYQQQIQQSIKDLSDQANQFQKQLQQQYQQQAQQYNQQYQNYINSNMTYTDAQGRVHYQTSGPGTGQYLSGSQYTGQASQIAQLARQAGFPPDAIPTVVAIALAESGGRADAVNNANRNGSSDYGLMQINSVHGNLLNNYNWSDPAQNMQMAYQIYKDAGNSFSPWSTYNNGAANQFMDTGISAARAAQMQFQSQPNISTTPSGQLRQNIVSSARQYFGIPYEWGGDGPAANEGFDCSGLVQQVYGQYGIKLPRVANDQARAIGTKTSIANLQPGDLVAWAGNRPGEGPDYVGHIAIYAGNGQIIEAQTQGTVVHQRALGINDKVYGIHINFG